MGAVLHCVPQLWQSPLTPSPEHQKGVSPWKMELLPKYHLTHKCTRLELKLPFEKPAASHPEGEIVPLS